MAVIKQFTVTIQVNGQALPEHPNLDDESAGLVNTVSNFVQAEPDEEFGIAWRVAKGFNYKSADYLTVLVFLDGNCVDSEVIPKKAYTSKGKASGVTDSMCSGSGDEWTEQKFKFGRLSIRDTAVNENESQLKSAFSELGQIRVEIWRERGGVDPQGKLEGTLMNENSVPEKILKGKALGLATSLSPSQKIAPVEIYDGVEIDPDPIATFLFGYRTEDDLKKMRIIDRTPTPVPLEEIPINELTPDQMRERMLRAEATIKEKEVKIKQERREANTRFLEGLKRSNSSVAGDNDDEVQAIASPVKKAKVIEVIELD